MTTPNAGNRRQDEEEARFRARQGASATNTSTNTASTTAATVPISSTTAPAVVAPPQLVRTAREYMLALKVAAIFIGVAVAWYLTFHVFAEWNWGSIVLGAIIITIAVLVIYLGYLTFKTPKKKWRPALGALALIALAVVIWIYFPSPQPKSQQAAAPTAETKGAPITPTVSIPAPRVQETEPEEEPLYLSIQDTIETDHEVEAKMPRNHNMEWTVAPDDVDKVMWRIERRRVGKNVHKVQIFALKPGVMDPIVISYEIFPCTVEIPCYAPKS